MNAEADSRRSSTRPGVTYPGVEATGATIPGSGPTVVTPTTPPMPGAGSTAGVTSGSSAPPAEAPGYAERLREAAREYGQQFSHASPTPADGHGGNGHHRHASPGDNPATAAFRAIPLQLKELASWTAYYLGAKADGLKLTLRNIAVYAALGVVGLIAGVAVICTAVILVLTGLSQAISSIFINHPALQWIGPLAVGLLVLGGLAIGVKIGLAKVLGSSKKQTLLKYEGKRIRQRIDFGRDVTERATQSKKRQKQERKHESAGGAKA